MKNMKKVSVGVVGSLLLGACGGSSSSSTGDDQNVTDGALGYRASVEQCEVAYRAAADSGDESTSSMIQAAAARTECLTEANREGARQIEIALKEADLEYVGSAAEAFDGYRQAALKVCPLVAKAEGEGGSLERIFSATCTSEVENLISVLTVAYTMIDLDNLREVPSSFFQEPFATYPDCEIAPEGDDQQSMTIAAFASANCVAEEAGATIALEGAAPIVTSVRGAAGSLCGVLAEAGENGGGTLARLDAANCQAVAAVRFQNIAE